MGQVVPRIELRLLQFRWIGYLAKAGAFGSLSGVGDLWVRESK